MRSLMYSIPILVLAAPLAACGGGGDATPVSRTSPPPSLAGFGMVDAQTLVTPDPPRPQPIVEHPVVEQPVAVAQPAPAPAPLPPPKTYAEAMHRAQELGDAGDHAGAIDALHVAVKLAPKSAAPQVELARLYLADNKLVLARKHATKATELNPSWSQAWNTLGRIEMADGKLDDARAAFQTAIESNEDNVFAWNNLGLSYIYSESWQDAADALEHAVAQADAKPYMWNNLGIAYEHLDKLDEARHAYDQAAAAGSDAGKLSRKRLEGVKSIVKATAAVEPAEVAPAAPAPAPAPAPIEATPTAPGGGTQ